MSRSTRATKRALMAEVDRLKAEVEANPTSEAYGHLSAARAKLGRFYSTEVIRLGRISMRLAATSMALALATIALLILKAVLS